MTPVNTQYSVAWRRSLALASFFFHPFSPPERAAGKGKRVTPMS